MNEIFQPATVRDIICLCKNIVASEGGLNAFVENLKYITGCDNISVDENVIYINGKKYTSKDSIIKEAEAVLNEYMVPRKHFPGIHSLLVSRECCTREDIAKALKTKYNIKTIITKSGGICIDCNLFYDIKELQLYFDQKVAVYDELISKCNYSEYITDSTGVILDGMVIVASSSEEMDILRKRYPNYGLYGIYDSVNGKVIWKYENDKYFIPVETKSNERMHFFKSMIENNVYTVTRSIPLGAVNYILKPYPVAKDPNGQYLYAYENPESIVTKVANVARKASNVGASVVNTIKEERDKKS